MAVKQMNARYAGRCSRCGQKINVGDRILYSTQDHRSNHMRCPLSEEPVRTRPLEGSEYE